MKFSFKLNDQFVSKTAKKYIAEDTAKIISDYLLSHSFEDQSSYNDFVTGLMKTIAETKRAETDASEIFHKELAQIEKKTPLIEKTPWGLVSMQKVDVAENFIQKLLVIKQDGILGFEYHERKHEKLNVLEGVSLIIYANHASEGWEKGQLTAQIAAHGDTFEFMPYDEHGMVALTDAVIEETSTNDLDDLIFIFDSHQII